MPVVLLIIAILVLSQSANFIRFAHADASAIGFWRLLMACMILLPIVFYKKQFSELQKTSTKQKVQIFFCAFFLFVHFYFWFLSVQKTTVANSMILFTTNPLFTAIGAWFFFHEKLQKRHAISLVLCFSGIFWMVRESLEINPKNFQGDILGFLCAIAFSAYVLSGKSLRNSLSNLPFVLSIYAVCGFFFFVAMLVTHAPFLGYDAQTWASFAALTIGSTLLGHALFTHCLKYLNINFMSCSTLVEPVISALTASYLFGEAIRSAAVTGFVFVTLGILTLYSPYFYDLFTKKTVQPKRLTL